MSIEVLVVGTGITGRALVDFCLSRSIKVAVCDINFIDQDYKDFLLANGVDFKERSYSSEFMSMATLIVVSPSVRPESLPCDKSKIVSELDFAQQFFDGKIIAVTGTNGKTTTVSLITHLLSLRGLKVEAVGNIGVPFISVTDKVLDWVVVEASSFQLYSSKRFSPDISIILNILPDHLDWHKDFEEYVEAKWSIVKRTQNKIFLNANDALLQAKALELEDRNNIVWFEEDEELDEDSACVQSLAKFLNFDMALFSKAIKSFKKPRYRLELEGNLNSVPIINDSKATNTAATFWALKRLTKYYKRIGLICGGSSKGDDFSPIAEWKESIAKLYAYGQEADKIKADLSGVMSILTFDNLEQAFSYAVNDIDQLDLLLFSPMCASFDQYKNYKERGEHFERLVQNYFQSK